MATNPSFTSSIAKKLDKISNGRIYFCMKFLDKQEIYFVGIGGVSMSSLALYLHGLGYNVQGSDRQQSQTTKRLQSLGISVSIGATEKVTSQLVVRTSAVAKTHPQVIQAQRDGIPVILREELLGEIFDSFDTRIAVVGTHGKTTVTALLHHVLSICKVPHTAFVGGKSDELCFGGGNVVVAEGCEYNRSFLHLHPTHTLCLNVQYDHPDCYQNLDDVKNAFSQLFEQSQEVILPSELQSVYQNGLCYDDFCAKEVCYFEQATIFDLYNKEKFVSKVYLKLTGQHNVTNALAVICLCNQLSLPFSQVLRALATFGGVDRRWTAKPFWCRLICDYAHHPTELSCAVNTAKRLTKGKVFCIFQPHTYTRTQAFWEQFATCFDGVSVLYLPIFSARESPIDGVTSLALCRHAKTLGIDAHYAENFAQAKTFVESNLSPKDTLLILGAGDVVEFADYLKLHTTN